jgi:cytoskeletal protein CcmA (bactofilin family)
MSLSGSNKIAKSMNGLLKIDAGEINAEIANIGIINSVSEINGKTDENLIFDVDVGRVIEFKDSVVMDQSLNITGVLNVTGTSNLTGVVASGNVSSSSLTVSGTSNLNSISATGNISGSSLNISGTSALTNVTATGSISASSLSVLNTSTFTGNIIANGISTFNADVFANLNLHAKTFDVSNNSIFNGSITAKGITSNGVCTFNNPVINNSSVSANGNIHGFSLDISNNSIFNTSTHTGLATHNADVVNNFNTHSNTLDVSGNSYFKGPVTADSTLDVSGNVTFKKLDVNALATFNSVGTFNSDVFCKALVDISGNLTMKKMTASDVATHNADIVCNNNIHSNTLDVSGNSFFKNQIDVTGNMTIRDPANPTGNSLTAYYDPAFAGFRFRNNANGAYMYFTVKDPAGNFKNFQFQHSQAYMDMPLYVNANVTLSYGRNLYLGDSNLSVFFGSSFRYVGDTSPTGGLIIYNKGFGNGSKVYSNVTHNNLSNVEVPTLRMSFEEVNSKVAMKCDTTLDVSGNTIIQGNLTLSGAGTTLKFPDNTTQESAFSVASATKLNAIGTIYTATLVPTFIMTSGTLYNLGSVILDAGSYLFTVNVEIRTITGTTSIGQCTAGYSLSSSSLSQSRNLALTNFNAASLFAVGSRQSLNTAGFVANGTDGTEYFCVCRVVYGSANRVQFMNDNLLSQFRFTRIG